MTIIGSVLFTFSKCEITLSQCLTFCHKQLLAVDSCNF